MKTENELKQEWGLAKFLKATARLSTWKRSKGDLIDKQDMIDLHNDDLDAFRAMGAETRRKWNY